MANTGMTVGLIKALSPEIDPATIQSSVEDWLDDHPEATTTVQDGAITTAKLDATLQGAVTDVGDIKSVISNYNELVNPAVYWEDDVTTGAAWTDVTFMRNIYLKANVNYKFTFTIPSALSNNGYINVFNPDGTKLVNNQLFASGTTTVVRNVTPSADVDGGYVKISFGTANVSVHCEYKGFSDVSYFTDIQNNIEKIADPTVNLIGNSLVGVFAIQSGAIQRTDKNNLATWDLIPCESSTAYSFRAFGDDMSLSYNYNACWYDTNGAYISNSTASTNAGMTATSPSTSKFMRFAIQRDGLLENTKLMIVAGSTPPSYYVPALSAYDVVCRDALTENQPEINNVRNKLGKKVFEYPVTIEQGGFDGNGLNYYYANRLRSQNYIPVEPGNWIKIDVKYSGTSIDVLPIYYTTDDFRTAELSRHGSYLESPAYFTCPKDSKYVRLYINNDGANIVPENATCTVTVYSNDVSLRYVYPMVASSDFSKTVAIRKNVQDIAVYNGHIFDFGTGTVSVDGGSNIEIENGHGNNCNFGTTLHGSFPYLYCGSWVQNEGNVYVNQYANGVFTLVNTIHFDLSGYLNCCVDEANQRVYILLCTSSDTAVGEIDFVVGDFSGNVISQITLADPIPHIEGMSFYGGKIYVSSGYRETAGYPSYLTIFDTTGNIVSRTSPLDCCEYDAVEGFDIDNATGRAYIGMINTVMM